eukprot:7245349-Prymnesium_polylepis.1
MLGTSDPQTEEQPRALCSSSAVPPAGAHFLRRTPLQRLQQLQQRGARHTTKPSTSPAHTAATVVPSIATATVNDEPSGASAAASVGAAAGDAAG